MLSNQIAFRKFAKYIVRRTAGALLLAQLMIALGTAPASSQGIIESLLGAFQRPAPRDLPPPDVASAQPIPLPDPLSESRSVRDTSGPFVAYCVRLCDGRFFPLPRSLAQSPADQCRSFCPAARTKIFGGNSIGLASAADGSRYANLDTAFLFRTRLVDNCTCNGRDAFGVARVQLASDPTLRAGDIVAVNGGFAAYTGARATARQNAEFTPIEHYSGVSNDTRRKLAQTKVLPAKQPAKQAPVAQFSVPLSIESKSASRFDRRAQLLR